jgi:hypothetical protein
MGSRQLEEVIFRFDGSWDDEGILKTEWIKLDAILASPQFATLKDIRFPCPSGVANHPELAATLLPTCHARDILSFIDLPGQYL